jgi:branched-chain amino acid transport system ATP-binding protein
MSAVLLEAQRVTRRFGGIVALDGVDFQISANEVVGIIGPNGSGKTTLFNVLSGFIKPNSGTLSWLGRDVTRKGAHHLAQSGLVRTFQETMLFPGLTVRENVEMAIRLANDGDTDPVETILEFVNLSHVIDLLAGELSWGQSRLLGIALALTIKPKALLLDEPFAGLSPAAAEDLTVVIRRIRESGYSVGVIDHEMSFLLPVCDRLVVLVNGKAIADGPPLEVIELAAVRSAYLGV